jgi:hypothetical protein
MQHHRTDNFSDAGQWNRLDVRKKALLTFFCLGGNVKAPNNRRKFIMTNEKSFPQKSLA